jgi:hypothetical protein
MKAKLLVALALALTVAGCASGPYAYDSVYYDGYRPYAYGGSSYDYSPGYYAYPGVIGGSVYYDRRDYDRDQSRNRYRDDRDKWQGRGRDDRDNWQGRGRDGRDNSQGRGRDDRGRPDRNDGQGPRGQPDTRHGEAGNEAGM